MGDCEEKAKFLNDVLSEIVTSSVPLKKKFCV